MAQSETLPAQTAKTADTAGVYAFVEAAERALTSGDLDLVADADVASVLTAALRLYTAKVGLDNKPISPVLADKLTPTDVVVSVTAIIRAAGLNLWDLSMWFQRPHS
jgi:hypothetical protein